MLTLAKNTVRTAILVGILSPWGRCDAFRAPFFPGTVAARNGGRTKPSGLILSATADKATLTDETTWRLRLNMEGMRTAKGKKLDNQFYVLNLQFLEEDGYEPPQGIVRQVNPASEDAETLKGRLQVSDGRWQLSEDPDDRKDGLWIWGLFKEPLYPFMLLQLETKEIELPKRTDDEENDDADSILPLKLYAQIPHIRDKESGVVLQTSVINIRQMEMVKADLLGAAQVEVYEETSMGQIDFQPAASGV